MVLQLRVADVMTQPVLSVTPDTPLQQAVQLISDRHISGLPVVDDAGVLIGELSEQDLMVSRERGGCRPLRDASGQRDLPAQSAQLGQAGAPGARHHGEGPDAEGHPHLQPGAWLAQGSLTAA
ncbi:CBS domains-containing protein [Synechococcus sp. BOUM118]|nr:CBS domains-containing protein [Synechococcus sp. BOUM118]